MYWGPARSGSSSSCQSGKCQCLAALASRTAATAKPCLGYQSFLPSDYYRNRSTGHVTGFKTFQTFKIEFKSKHRAAQTMEGSDSDFDAFESNLYAIFKLENKFKKWP